MVDATFVRRCALVIALCGLCALSGPGQAADAQRQSEVAQRGADVMPFSLSATTHVFTKLPDGGIQRVVVKDPTDTSQRELVRGHLKEMQSRFAQGDYAGPLHIHGAHMPGLATLRTARPGQITVTYRALDDGAELAFESQDALLVSALHEWFDAQLDDHGADAMAGHHTHHPGMSQP